MLNMIDIDWDIVAHNKQALATDDYYECIDKCTETSCADGDK